LLLAACLLSLAQVAAAEPLPDPTRPAIDLGAGTGGAGGGAEAAPVEAAPRGLQSTIISPHYRAAIINGETVRLGGKSGDSRLVEVREDSVLLQDAQGRRRVMELFPRVRIKMIEAVQQPSGAQEQAGTQPGLPEMDVGGVK
jgi:MSHA biogenesis protein MshK